MNTHLKNVVESTAAAFGNFSQFEKSDSPKNQEIVKTEFIEHWKINKNYFCTKLHLNNKSPVFKLCFLTFKLHLRIQFDVKIY